MGGDKWRVAYVNGSRAHCVCETKRTVTVTDPRTGNVRSFTATASRTIDISPDSQIGLLKEMGAA